MSGSDVSGVLERWGVLLPVVIRHLRACVVVACAAQVACKSPPRGQRLELETVPPSASGICETRGHDQLGWPILAAGDLIGANLSNRQSNWRTG